jgi:4-amino-4-deoxy-L-arabinose transferase-like glycosyltransferase
MFARRWLAAIWLCFLARAVFYCAALPIWEGYDEWSHFAVVQRMAFRGEALVSRSAPIGRDIAESLELAPVAWECRTLAPPSLTQDDFWQLRAEERADRESRFRAIPVSAARQDSTGPLQAYEGLQGPLYGWIMAPVLLVASHAHLSTQVLLVRLFGVLLVSLIIPMTYRTARFVLGEGSALGCAAVVAVMPEFLIDTARAGNDGVAAVLFTAVIWLSLEVLRYGLTRGRAIALGAALGFGLLAKAYVLTALPPVAILLLWKERNRRSLVVPLVAFGIAGWWYMRNQLTTGAVTGMWESALRSNAGIGEQAQQIGRIPWGVAIDSILFSHLYHGGWSGLTVRSWMYHLLYFMIALGAVGLVVRAWRNELAGAGGWVLLLAFFGSFWLGQLYHVIPMFMVWGIPSSMGCYLYAVVAAEVVLCVAGLRALVKPAAAIGVALFALLDLYTIHMVAIPYYSGLIAHRPNGAVAAFYPSREAIAQMLPRMAMFKSPLLSEGLLAALWIAYAGATVLLVAFSFWIARNPAEREECTSEAAPGIAASHPTGPARHRPTAAH